MVSPRFLVKIMSEMIQPLWCVIWPLPCLTPKHSSVTWIKAAEINIFILIMDQMTTCTAYERSRSYWQKTQKIIAQCSSPPLVSFSSLFWFYEAQLVFRFGSFSQSKNKSTVCINLFWVMATTNEIVFNQQTTLS